MKFSKYNNPSKKRRRKHINTPYFKEYIEEQKEQLYALLAKAKTEEEKDMIIKAFDVSIHP